MKTIKIESPRIEKLYNDLKKGREEALELFWNEIEQLGSPLIEKINDDDNYLVTLLWRESEELENVCVIGEMFGMDTDETRFEKLENTNLWYRTWRARGDAQSVYFYIINCDDEIGWDNLDFRLDPLNKNKYVCIEDDKRPDDLYLMLKENSYIALPEFKENQWTLEKQDIAKGKLELFNDFESKNLNNKRRVWVYTPAGYDETKEPYGLAVFTDGWEYINVTNAPTVLDNLIGAGMIPPMCAVFIETSDDRDNELTCHRGFREFAMEEVVTWVKEKYNITNKGEKNALIGFSYGGLVAAFMALEYAESFKNVFIQSGGFAWKPTEEDKDKDDFFEDYEKSEKLPVKFYVTFGEYEKDAEEHFNGTKKFVRLLEDKGYSYKYKEFMGGHTYMDAKIEFADGLIHLLGE